MMPRTASPSHVTTAFALCAQALAAMDRAGALCTANDQLRTAASHTRERSIRLRAWRSSYRSPRAPIAAALLARGGMPAPARETARRSRGRIVVRGPRVAAAQQGRAAEDAAPRIADVGATPQWAHATVYATRELFAAHIADVSSPIALELLATWTVREIDARGMPGARGPRCLVFENSCLVRRVWTYPAQWAELADEALLRLAGLL